MPKPSAETGAIAVVEDFLGALEALDTERALALLADDVTYQNYPLPADRGKPAVTKTLKRFLVLVDQFRVENHNIAERDGVVLTERTDVLIGPFVYLDIRVNGTFEVRDGKIVAWRDYFDVGETLLKLLVGPLRRRFHAA